MCSLMPDRGYPWKPEKEVGAPGPEVNYSCEPSNVCLGAQVLCRSNPRSYSLNILSVLM